MKKFITRKDGVRQRYRYRDHKKPNLKSSPTTSEPEYFIMLKDNFLEINLT